MLSSVNWGEKLGQAFGGHLGRVLKVTLIFACSVILLLGLYRVRTSRITKEETNKIQLKSSGVHGLPLATADKWLIVGNPDDTSIHSEPDGITTASNSDSDISGTDYACAAANVAKNAGWKSIIIGPQISCCSKPDCYSMEKSQFLRLPYRSASVIRHLLGHGLGRRNAEPYKETIRNVAFLWALHRGAKFIFDAYVDEYQSARVPLQIFEDELSRQLKTLALDESLSLVEERSGGGNRIKSNPYSHFGRPDVKLLPGGPSSEPTTSSTTKHHSHNHQHIHSILTQPTITSSSNLSILPKNYDYPSYRICEVRPPSIEKFLEIDEGWWDVSAPSLVLPGDTMPPLCTRNTLFSPEVFWALPLLPDYSTDDDGLSGLNTNSSRIPPWYIRGLWSQSLLGDLGGSIRLSLSKVPTLQLTQDYLDGDYDSLLQSTPTTNRTRGSRLLKRWNCRSKSIFRCLLLMSKELTKSIYMGKDDISLIEAWVVDLKSISYNEPRMLPKRRTHTNPCLGVDGLHGVSFYPAIEPKYWLSTNDFITKRNITLRDIVARLATDGENVRDKRETERPFVAMNIPQNLLPPSENSTYSNVDWSLHTSDYGNLEEGKSSTSNPVHSYAEEDSYLPQQSQSGYEDYRRTDYMYAREDSLIGERGIPLPSIDNPSRSAQVQSTTHSRTGKQFRAFLQQVVTKSVRDGIVPDEYPILKAMADNMCPGFGPLLPYQPTHLHSDILLIIVFTNHHYDLIPTLEVLYRSIYPNILYCGHPHESVEIFRRKYQTVEHRSFSFLPTYTRASYECVLGAIEMNYDVKGYKVITDETLLGSMNTDELEKDKLWVSSTGWNKVTRSNWQRIDPGGQKLPRLIDGITSSWKLFTYILQGLDSLPFLQSDTKGRRRRKRDERTNLKTEFGETLQRDETAYFHGSNFRWEMVTPPPNHNHNSSSNRNQSDYDGNNERVTTGSGERDLQVSDWDYLKRGENQGVINNRRVQNDSIAEESGDEEVLIGEEDDDNPIDSNMSDIMIGLSRIEAQLNSSSPSPILIDGVTDEVTIESESVNKTNTEFNVDEGILSSTPGISEQQDPTESSLGVPLYHVEHIEPPTHPKWHPPEEMSTTETQSLTSSTPPPPTSTILSITPNSGEVIDTGSIEVGDELRREMEGLLEAVHETYINLIGVVNEYDETNGDNLNEQILIHNPIDFSGEVNDGGPMDDLKSHRISPREFRHIRCTRIDDGHQSELCDTLRNYVKTLGHNIGRDIRLFHDSIPIYYIPSSSLRTFYSIGNVLLHYGVTDELGLPILFRGLSIESDWITLNRTTELNNFNNRDKTNNHFLYPFNFHKVYSDSNVRKSFCENYLLNILRL